LTFGKWLQQSAYIKGDCISIDGSKIRANASRSFDLDHVSKKLEQLDAQLQEYMAKISRTDQVDEECEQAEKEKEQLHQYIKELQQQINELELKKLYWIKSKPKRISPTDPQARVMKSRQGKHFCYNVQVVVDEKHKLISCNQVYNHENDKGLLKPMVEQAEEALDRSPERSSCRCWVPPNEST